MHPFCPSVYCVLVIYGITVLKQYVVESNCLVFHTSRGISSSPADIYIKTLQEVSVIFPCTGGAPKMRYAEGTKSSSTPSTLFSCTVDIIIFI